jgi:3-oxoacyl-[acyl-carrier protein] reductase
MTDNRGKVAVITGANQGIGFEIANKFLVLGYRVVGIDLDVSNLDQIKDVEGNSSLWIRANVTDRNDVSNAVAHILTKFGRIDVLVNNAGITRDALFHKMTFEEWQQVLDVNVTGGFHITQLCQAEMVKQRYGRIIFISSRSALGNRGQANYATSKAAVQGLTKTLAIELGKFGVTVNAIAPGFIETDMTRAIAEKTGQDWNEIVTAMKARAAVNRTGKPSDIAHVAAFFADPESSFVTGQVLYVTGSPNV